MKDYLEIESVKKARDDFKNSVSGQLILNKQKRFFSTHLKEMEDCHKFLVESLKSGNFRVNEPIIVSLSEEISPMHAVNTICCVLRDDGCLYYGSSYPLAVLGLGYRMRNGKVEVCE